MESPKQSSNFRHKRVKEVFGSAIESWICQTIALSVFWSVAGIVFAKSFELVVLLVLFVAFLQLIIERRFVGAIVQRQKLKLEYFNIVFMTSLGFGVFVSDTEYSVC
ncbi:hypothetical protein I8752_00435 [Nostocaceae cyanobacterium CENA369]|uniref:Uncharacterized protein n=1 Tax=Dendronalium phyllosphericum CENA369 TaxID=1725256 RepID=A0A8J7HWQ4_9NOST|nr:hypothetical protein [Dendronalium phyllosphericum]MBH8571515.1 hypothetical protein [Dendronalium phyllosphericum CENA369]